MEAAAGVIGKYRVVERVGWREPALGVVVEGGVEEAWVSGEGEDACLDVRLLL